MRKYFSIISLLFIAVYLLFGRSQWFSELDRQAEIGRRPIQSEKINISKHESFIWEIPRDGWVYNEYGEGKAELRLILDIIPKIDKVNYEKENINLRIKVNCYAITKDGLRINRLIENWYYKTNEPFGELAKQYWVAWGAESIKYGLASIQFFPFEKTFIEIEVLEPDIKLSSAKPRLELVGDHDYAIYGHLPLLHLMRDGGLIICLLSLAFFAWSTIKSKTKI